MPSQFIDLQIINAAIHACKCQTLVPFMTLNGWLKMLLHRPSGPLTHQNSLKLRLKNFVKFVACVN